MEIDVTKIKMVEEAVMEMDCTESIQTEDAVHPFEVRVKGTLTCRDANGDFVLIFKGTMQASVPVLCDRCLTQTAYQLNFLVEEQFCQIEKEGYHTLVGSTIIFDPVIQSRLAQHRPMKILCDDDCKGLCPTCGKNRNQSPCNCDTTYRNPAFEGLMSLFSENEEV